MAAPIEKSEEKETNIIIPRRHQPKNLRLVSDFNLNLRGYGANRRVCLTFLHCISQDIVTSMQTAVYVLIALYDGSIGSASQAMAAADQFASQLTRKNF